MGSWAHVFFGFQLVMGLVGLISSTAGAAETAAGVPGFVVREYRVQGEVSFSTNTIAALAANYTGTNVSVADIVKAASDLQSDLRKAGEPNVTVAVAQDRITNGIVTLNMFRGKSPCILISGVKYANFNDAPTPGTQTAASDTGGNTNTGPHFTVNAYQVQGDTLLSDNTLMSIFAKRTGTNVGIRDIVKGGSELQAEYRDRGYPTVSVTIPPQQITNGLVKIRVFTGRLAEIVVTNNHYFSSNNVMRYFPSLRTNEIMRGAIFQAELDQANANQDRQIYPQVAPGPRENTSTLILDVKDRLPLHGKVEFNNQSSPGTPDLRVNSSLAYNNLWQLEHSMGVQYSVSPEAFKAGPRWDWYDQPIVANYSGYYRMPLGNPTAVDDTIASSQGRFGYNEATRKFDLPTPSGRPELTFYGSRSTIDTGLQLSPAQVLLDIPFVRSISRQDSQQDVTFNENAGFRLSEPLPESKGWRLNWSGGGDYKYYLSESSKTNTVIIKEITVDANNQPNPPTISTISSPTPRTRKSLEYFPVALRLDANRRTAWGITTVGLNFGANPWYSGTRSNLQSISGSRDSDGHWVVINPSFSQDIFFRTNWTMSLRMDGQWASEPLISNEQFGIGGINSVRGYHEGQVFGDTGWHTSLEFKTPPHVVGIVYGRQPLTVRGTVYMDYGEAYLLDPQGRNSGTSLWGTGLGFVATAGSHWEARLLFSWPLIGTPTISAYEPFFNFALTAQF